MAKAKNAKIDIYRALKPKSKYSETGELTCPDTDEAWVLKQVLIKAREIGADGIIIFGGAGDYGVGVPVGGTIVQSASKSDDIRAVAIKYINQ